MGSSSSSKRTESNESSCDPLSPSFRKSNIKRKASKEEITEATNADQSIKSKITGRIKVWYKYHFRADRVSLVW